MRDEKRIFKYSSIELIILFKPLKIIKVNFQKIINLFIFYLLSNIELQSK